MITLRKAALALAVVPTLLVTGCSGDSDPKTPGAATTAAVPSSSASAAPTTSSASASASPSATATATATTRPSRVPRPVTPPIAIPSGAGVTVLLQGDGLGFVSGSGSVRQVPFGASVTTITTALSATLGKGKTSAQPECGQGPRTQVDYNGFTVLLAGSRFVGWTERGSAERDLSTADGIALQVTLAEVKQAYPKAKVSNGSLGPEFFVEGGVSGLLNGTTAQSRVTQLYGGETCFFR